MSIKVVNSLSHLHGLDHRPCAFRCARLGAVRLLRGAVLPGAVVGNRKQLYSLKLVSWHFWIATIGIVLYISAMWVSGICKA